MMDFYQRNELPETVKRYKMYTDAFQEWLMETAIQRGVENAAHIAEQAKRKKKGKKSYKISVEQQEILVDGIAYTNEPLIDTSGLRDLQDAIRSRKEVTQFHELSRSLDTGHSFFNSVLENAHTRLAKLITLIPMRLKAQELEDDASTFTVCLFNKDEAEDIENATEEIVLEEAGHEKRQEDNREDTGTACKRRRTDNPLSRQEVELQRDFLVLCFLYELNRVREVVQEVWMLYHQEALSVITAALVTDLVQSYIQQNVAALVEDLDSYDYELQLPLSEIVQQLYTKLAASEASPIVKSAAPELSDKALRHLLCIDAIRHLEVYLNPTPSTKDDKISSNDRKFSPLQFLQHFDAVLQGKVELPIWDKFTEAMIQRTKKSDAYLSFGFQIVLDVHEMTREDYTKIFKDVTQHGFDIAQLIRTHVDYEDYMWEIGKKPDYMSYSNMKFSNVYLSSMHALLKWIQELLKTDNQAERGVGINTGVFVTIHSTLAGLSMWNFHRTYHGFSIAKVRWFITTLAHLYNAAAEVGGLDYAWPDLDYIIEMHGVDRVFVGGPPVNPREFLERYCMSTCVSSRIAAKDYRPTGKYLPPVSAEMKKKRGLIPHFPLEDAIAKYYGPDEKGERWLRRHAIFNCLHQLAKDDADGLNQLINEDANGLHRLESETGIQELGEVQDNFRLLNEMRLQKLKELQNTFSSIATRIAPSRSKNRRNNPPRVPTPNFAQADDTYATLFRAMRSELESHELHSNFDYLSFYRRAYDLVLSIRSEVLFDNASQLARRGDIKEDQNPNNQTLLVELFSALKTKPKNKKVKTSGDEMSTEVVPLEQLKRITKILEAVISKEGSVELDRARMRLGRDWDGLKVAYDSEKDKEHGSGSPEQSPPVGDEPQAGHTQLPRAQEDTKAEKIAKSAHRPPGYWRDESDTGAKDDLCSKDPAESDITSAPGSKPPATIEEDDESTEIPTFKSLGVYDDLLGEFDSELGSDSDSNVHIRHGTSNSKPTRSPAEALLGRAKDADARILLTANKLTQKPHQAYVSDVTDEAHTWSTSSHVQPPIIIQEADVDDTATQDDIYNANAVYAADHTSASLELEGHRQTDNLHRNGTGSGNITAVRSCEQDHAVRERTLLTFFKKKKKTPDGKCKFIRKMWLWLKRPNRDSTPADLRSAQRAARQPEIC
jgi:hypothetical protein